MTLAIAIPAAGTFVAGVIMMLPPMRIRSVKRGMSGDIIIPGLIAVIGAVLFLIGIYI